MFIFSIGNDVEQLKYSSGSAFLQHSGTNLYACVKIVTRLEDRFTEILKVIHCNVT